jgi:hypothetical protein
MNKAILVSKIEEMLKAQNTVHSESELGSSIAIIIDNYIAFTVFDDGFILSVNTDEIGNLRERGEVDTVTDDLVPSNTDLSINVNDQNVDELLAFWIPKAVFHKG